MSERKGLWANIHAKRERIANGSGEHMRRPGSEGAPTEEALKKSAFLKGYLAKAAEYGLSQEEAIANLELREKQAIATDGMTDGDIAALRSQLAQGGLYPVYNDPYGDHARDYSQRMLAARDKAVGTSPEVAGAKSAIGGGLFGGVMGAGLGHMAGTMAGHPKILGASPSNAYLRGKLPKLLKILGMIGGASAGAIPAYGAKKQEVESLQRLSSPENMRKLMEKDQLDKAYTNSWRG